MFAFIRRLYRRTVVASGLQPTQERRQEEVQAIKVNELLALQQAKEDEKRRIEHIQRELMENDEKLKSITMERKTLQQQLMFLQSEENKGYDTSSGDQNCIIDSSVPKHGQGEISILLYFTLFHIISLLHMCRGWS